jgi:hypothetical protein
MIESEHGRTNAGAQEQKAQHLSQQKDEIWPVTEPNSKGHAGLVCAEHGQDKDSAPDERKSK